MIANIKMSRFLAILVLLVTCTINNTNAIGDDTKNSIPVIPSAQWRSGFGIDTVAGSGRHLGTTNTTICKVVNLNDSGTGVDTDDSDGVVSGDLRYCVEKVDSPKVIIFEVSGTIELGRTLFVGGGDNSEKKGSYITIAGQTAPSPGITLKNYGIYIDRNCHDILVQHIRVRPGDTSMTVTITDGWNLISGTTYSRKINESKEVKKVFYNGALQANNGGAGSHVAVGEWDFSTTTKTLYVNMGEDPSTKDFIYSVGKSQISDPLVLSGEYNEADPAWRPPYNVVVDHCSFSWGGDMNVQTGGDYNTFSNNIISEALHSPFHPKGPHSKGFMVIGYEKGEACGMYVAIVNNLLSHNTDRNPLVTSGKVVIANNVIYDMWSSIGLNDSDYEKRGYVLSSVAANYLIETVITYIGAGGMGLSGGNDPNTRYYLSNDNFFNKEVQTDPWSSVNSRLNGSSNSDIPLVNRASNPPVWPQKYTTKPISEVKNYVLTSAGARPKDRDSVDKRIAKEALEGSLERGIIVSPNDVGGWPVLEENVRPLTIPDKPHEIQQSGYTNLEKWLHGFASEVEGRPKAPSDVAATGQNSNNL